MVKIVAVILLLWCLVAGFTFFLSLQEVQKAFGEGELRLISTFLVFLLQKMVLRIFNKILHLYSLYLIPTCLWH